MNGRFKWLPALFAVLLWQSAVQAASLAEARQLMDAGADEQALQMLRALQDAEAGDYRFWFMRGVIEARQKDFQSAIGHFRKALELRPTLAEAHNNLAVIYNEMGDLRGAIRELEASLELNPDYATAHENIGDLYVKLALESYQRAMDGGDAALIRRYQRLQHLRDAEVRPVAPGVYASITGALERWRTAWSARDIDAYFAAYAPDFEPAGRFADVGAWRRYKRRVIGRTSFIDVKLEDVRVLLLSDTRAVVDFIQFFRSDGYHSRDHKQLTLEKYRDGWKVVDESVL